MGICLPKRKAVGSGLYAVAGNLRTCPEIAKPGKPPVGHHGASLEGIVFTGAPCPLIPAHRIHKGEISTEPKLQKPNRGAGGEYCDPGAALLDSAAVFHGTRYAQIFFKAISGCVCCARDPVRLPENTEKNVCHG